MPDAIQKLKAYIEHTKVEVLPNKLPDMPNLDYSVDRFGLAYYTTGSFGPDEIVLLRQALRWSGMQEIRVDRPPEQSEQMDQWLSDAGIIWTLRGYLSAEPYTPDWMEEDPIVIDEPPHKRTVDESYAAEPYLYQVGFKNWRSQAQKESAWIVVNAPEGSTRMIVLPTGCGKSLCFQLLPLYSTGLTVVVVPTVALAIDQYRIACKQLKNLPNLNPCFFAADDNPDVTLVKLKNKNTRLIFASPETCVSGKLRPILDKYARNGWFQNLVIDEAHLIETWGAKFRVEFQILAATRRKWLADSGNRLRTFLFSATMSPYCRKSLSMMFAKEGNAQEFVCQRLRPEMKYFSRCFKNDEERWPHLREAIWRLPRPAILYLTKPYDAQKLHNLLRNKEGFKRIGCFTGETRRDERKNLLEAWMSNKIDLMVATSAFGVGVDQGTVRTIIHACYPENLDRYYQEVGRSGRDGYSSICLLIPTIEDRETARNLGVTLMTKESIQERWEALYKASRRIDGDDEYTFELPIEAKRMSLVGTRTYSENIRWNKRLLMQLHRAQLIELIDLKLEKADDPEENPQEWAKVSVTFPPGTPRVGELISSQRDEELGYFREGFEQLEELLSSKRCVSRSLQKIYKVPSEQRVCGGCRYCRKNKRELKPCPKLHIPKGKIKSGEYKSTIVESWPDPTQLSQKEEFMDKIEDCLRKHGLKPLQLYCPEVHFKDILALLERVLYQYPDIYRIDPFSEDSVLRSLEDHCLLFLHIGHYSEKMFEMAKITGRSNHLFCTVQNPYEPNGRHIKIKYDCDSWQSPETWLEQLT